MLQRAKSERAGGGTWDLSGAAISGAVIETELGRTLEVSTARAGSVSTGRKWPWRGRNMTKSTRGGFHDSVAKCGVGPVSQHDSNQFEYRFVLKGSPFEC